MQYQWLNKNNNKSLILFFSGWGMTPDSTGHLKYNDNDLIVFYDYCDIENIVPLDFNKYEKINIIAWSMGVWAAPIILNKLKVKHNIAIAINGTTTPISDDSGIPTQVYSSTLNNLSELNIKKFYLRMCGSKIEFEKFSINHKQKDIEILKQELITIKNMQDSKTNKINWNCAIICKNDLIFPFSNLENFWKSNTKNILRIEAPHYPFFLWKHWDDIINFYSINSYE